MQSKLSVISGSLTSRGADTGDYLAELDCDMLKGNSEQYLFIQFDCEIWQFGENIKLLLFDMKMHALIVITIVIAKYFYFLLFQIFIM